MTPLKQSKFAGTNTSLYLQIKVVFEKIGEQMKRDLIRAILRWFYAVARLRWPRILATYTLRRKAKNPKTFGQHVLYKMAYERFELRQLVSDKLLVRDYIESKIGPGYLPELFAKAKNPAELFQNNLPSQFVLKVNHGSGGSVIVWEEAPLSNLLPKPNIWLGWKRFQINPKVFKREDAIRLLNYWLKRDYSYWAGRLPEWNYREIQRMCFVEELLLDKHKNLPRDYRFYTFDGVTKIIGVDTPQKNGTKSVKHFYPDWTPIDVTLQAGRRVLDQTSVPVEKPAELDKMLDLAEKLGRDFDWIRVDMYLIGDRIVIGELTNFPTAGQGIYSPKDLDNYLGKFFKVN